MAPTSSSSGKGRVPKEEAPTKNGDTNPRVESDRDTADPSARRNVTYGRNATMPVLSADRYAEVVLPALKEFNPEDIKLDGTVVAVGKRRTGKSWVFRDLMYRMKDKFPAGLVVSQTDELNKFWRQYIPAKYIYPTYQPEILDALFKRQKKLLNDNGLSDEEKDKIAPFFVLLDDVISDQRLKYDENLMELFVAGRHYRIFTLITTQYAKAITPVIRGNTDYCFIMKTIQQRQREALWEDFADFLTKEAFYQIIDAYTEDNEVLVVNTCPEQKVDPLEMLFWWKATDPGEFRVGSDEFWESAMATDNDVPPKQGPESASDLLTVKDFMPAPWGQFV
mgnify:FL=1|tara:strand:- start:4900 stop:5907 length:1008 start_codon:yes stop_codon:yes gene_type:complete